MKEKMPNLILPDKGDYKSLYYFTLGQLYSLDGVLNTSSILIEELREALNNASDALVKANHSLAKTGVRIDAQHAQVMAAIHEIHNTYKLEQDEK